MLFLFTLSILTITLISCSQSESYKDSVINVLESNPKLSEIAFTIKKDEVISDKEAEYYDISFNVGKDFYVSSDDEKIDYYKEILNTIPTDSDELGCKSCTLNYISGHYSNKDEDIRLLYTVKYPDFKRGKTIIEVFNNDAKPNEKFTFINESENNIDQQNDSNQNLNNQSLKLSNSNVKKSGSLIYVTGQITNQSNSHIDKIGDMVFLDENDQVISVKKIIVKLNAGDVMHFEELVGNNVGEPSTVKLQGF